MQTNTVTSTTALRKLSFGHISAPRLIRPVALLAAAFMVLSACAVTGEVASTPDSDETTEVGSSGAEQAEVESGLVPGTFPQRVSFPYVPAITIPDLSFLNEFGQLIDDELGTSNVTGFDTVGAECASNGDPLYDVGETFLDTNKYGIGEYRDNSLGKDVTIQIFDDGSGRFVDSSSLTDLEINVNSDGSGTYRNDTGATDLNVTVNADGSGRYVDNSLGKDIEITINSDGSGRYTDSSSLTDIEITANADGTGEFADDSGATDVLISVDEFGNKLFEDYSLGADIELEVKPDGSGRYTDSSSLTDIEITVESDGSGTYRDTSGARDLNVTFSGATGILDPGLLIVDEFPTFTVTGEFPPLDKIQLEEPCLTILRINADVLFDFDEAGLTSDGLDLIEQIAETDSLAGREMTIVGHTDSKGDNAYNQDLSERRAETVSDALEAGGLQGADLTSKGMAASRPIAENENPDGSDNPAGRQLNRRVEIIVGAS